MKPSFAQRRRALQTQLKQRHIGALLITHPPSWYYLTGFTGDAGALIVSGKGTTLVTDGRFTAQARDEMTGVSLVLHQRSLSEAVGEVLTRERVKRVAFDPGQMTVTQLRATQKAAGKGIQWVEPPGLVEGLRERKEAGEIAVMRKAALLASRIMTDAFKLLKPGVREIEVASEIEYQMRQLGASGPSFPSIVAFGGRSALPHAHPTSKRLKKNELVVLDLGVILGNYCSDMTRTVCVGRLPGRIRGWYNAVKEAEEAALAFVKAGVTCEQVDAVARGVLAGHRLDQYFVHSTGHGLGLEVHESPRVARGQKHMLVPGNVITIEPGVYVPGTGGIRIEDDIAVLDGRTEVLTRVSRDLLEL